MERRLAAIFAADVVGYSRLVGADEEGTIERFNEHRRQLIDPKIAEHQGRIVKTTGDGLLVEFASPVKAVRCAIEVQQGMADRNANLPQDRRIEFRIGINLCDVIVEDGDIYGDGVNVAARLEGIAEPGTIYISRALRDFVYDRPDIVLQDLGDRALKNIAAPVQVFRIVLAGLSESTLQASPPLVPDKPSIAVLPFANMSSDVEQEFFSDGITEDLITDLSKVSGLFVIARNSSFAYKNRSVSRCRISPWILAFASCLRGASAKPATACASRPSSSMPPTAAISGQSGSIATSPISSRCRTKWWRKLSARSRSR